ncbi:MAG: DUF1648 domain-containing protein [Bacteroidota bacterium]
MNRPRIQPPLTTYDKTIEVIGWMALCALITLPAMYYASLPDSIPTHFGPDGRPDAFSSKMMIWTLPIIGGITFLGLVYLNRFPHIFNYSTTITPENAERQYQLSTRMVRTINVVTTGLFVYLTYGTIHTALGNQEGLSDYFIFIFLGLTFIPLIVYLVQRGQLDRR